MPPNEHPSGVSPLSIPSEKWFDTILARVRDPLSLVVLIVLLLFLLAGGAAFALGHNMAGVCMILVIVGLFALAFWLMVSGAGKSAAAAPPAPPLVVPADKSEVVRTIKELGGSQVIFQDEQSLVMEGWMQTIYRLLPQALLYSMPTYYLNDKLQIMDWNVAFGLIFKALEGEIRGKHVNSFIARLANRNEVFDKAKEFSIRVDQDKAFPFIHAEELRYMSAEYGAVKLFKVAAQLNDSSGVLQGWAVMLWPMQIQWSAFETDLYEAVRRDKAWSVYSASYDRILSGYSKYRQLLSDVLSAVPAEPRVVLDLGAGTGNVSEVLLDRKHQVIALESNSGMVERLTHKLRNKPGLTILRGSAEHLELIKDESIDAVVMVNVLYSLDDPTACFREIYRVLRVGGRFAFSTTHEETDVEPLLDDIRSELVGRGEFDEKVALHYEAVRKINLDLQESVVRRYSRAETDQWLVDSNFSITKKIDSTYMGAVMVRHAVKK